MGRNPRETQTHKLRKLRDLLKHQETVITRLIRQRDIARMALDERLKQVTHLHERLKRRSWWYQVRLWMRRRRT